MFFPWRSPAAASSPTRRERLLRLIKMYERAEESADAQEIAEIIYEMICPEAADYEAIPLAAEEGPGHEELRAHYHAVGKRIRALRRERELSQEELARAAGLTQSHVSRLEAGTHTPTFLTVKRIAAALHMAPSEIDPSYGD